MICSRHLPTKMLIAVVISSVVPVFAQECREQAKSQPGTWVYLWYAEDSSRNQCTNDGAVVTYTHLTTSNRPPKPDAKLVVRLSPEPVPASAYFWYSEQQAATEEPGTRKCIAVAGRTQRFTEMTVRDHPAGKATDYRLVTREVAAKARYGSACPAIK